MRLIHRTLIATLALAAVPALAQTIKPGLWEVKQKPQLDPARQAQMDEAQKQLANLPPEQRKMMEQMMAQRGISMNFAESGMAIKICISPEQAAKNSPPVDTQGKCKHDISRNGANTLVRFSCTEPVMEGESQITAKGGDSYTSITRVTSQRHGKVETMSTHGEGRWLGSDCGGLKPVTQ